MKDFVLILEKIYLLLLGRNYLLILLSVSAFNKMFCYFLLVLIRLYFLFLYSSFLLTTSPAPSFVFFSLIKIRTMTVVKLIFLFLLPFAAFCL